MKDVLALFSPTAGDRLSPAALFALGLARAHGAHLSALITEIEANRPEVSAESDLMSAGEARIKPSSPTAQLARTAEFLLSAAKSANVSCEILEIKNQAISLRERVISCAQVRDVLIVDVHGPLNSPRKEIIYGALFGSGRPVILVPQNTCAFTEGRIVVAWDGTHSAVRAVRDALPFLIRAREVAIVSVIDDKAFSTPYSGDALCRYLARCNVDAEFRPINRKNQNIGATLLTFARHTEADLIVMGGFAHGFERALMLGSATQDIFNTRLVIPVLLSH